MYTILICNSLFKKKGGCHRQQTHKRQCLIICLKIKEIYLFIDY